MRSFDDWYFDLFESGNGACLNQQEIAEEAWDYQQSKVDELQKQRDSFIKAYEIEMNESVELKKRVDAAIYLLTSIKAENDLWGCDQVERQIELLEQALKGGEA